jgi:hypothetical protein
MSRSVTIAALTHDLIRKRSLAALVWDSDPEKAVTLPVPFGCSLETVQAEAEKAMRELSAETSTITVGHRWIKQASTDFDRVPV